MNIPLADYYRLLYIRNPLLTIHTCMVIQMLDCIPKFTSITIHFKF